MNWVSICPENLKDINSEGFLCRTPKVTAMGVWGVQI